MHQVVKILLKEKKQKSTGLVYLSSLKSFEKDNILGSTHNNLDMTLTHVHTIEKSLLQNNLTLNIVTYTWVL
jgi:hypothetical protein